MEHRNRTSGGVGTRSEHGTAARSILCSFGAAGILAAAIGVQGATQPAPPLPAIAVVAPPAVDPAAPALRPPLAHYLHAVRGNLFGNVASAAPRIARVVKPRKPVVIVKRSVAPPAPVAVAPVAPLAIDPFADWSYKGTVRMGETTMALLENTKSKEGQYVRPGDTFLGARVGSITDQMISLQNGGAPHMLAKSDTITVTPLDRSAAYLSAGPQQPSAGAKAGTPGAPPPGPPAMPSAPMPSLGGGFNYPGVTVNPDGSVKLPNGMTISGEMAQQALRFMRNMGR